jgi:YidC/Oxa1 family membrane protein insertase
VGDKPQVQLHTRAGDSFASVLEGIDNGDTFKPSWSVSKGEGVVSVDQNGTITALAPGDATVEGKIPGLAARSGFLFIKALGQVGFMTDGAVNWDIAILVAGFGASLFASQILSGMGMPANPQQSTANKITPVMITGMFLFFPLPAGVLLYMVIANVFQALQTFLLSREALPDNLQAILDQQMNQQPAVAGGPGGVGRLPFEPKAKK